MSEKITPSDLKKEAQRLVASGKMPSLEELLSKVAESREKYAPQIKEAGSETSE